MQLPGRFYTGPRKEHLAALKITSLFKVIFLLGDKIFFLLFVTSNSRDDEIVKNI